MSDNSPDISALERRVESISAAYKRLGWRFLAGPGRTFTSRTAFALITLNPGGAREDPDHLRTSSENGSAYWIESWKGYPPGTAPLQLYAVFQCSDRGSPSTNSAICASKRSPSEVTIW